MKVISVHPLPAYKLRVTFDDGVSGTIDLENFVKTGIFSVLENEDSFNKVFTNGYSVAWNEELEIDSLTIYAEILNKEPGGTLNSFEDKFDTEKLIERLLFVEKVEKGIKDAEERRVFDYKEAKQTFFDKWSK